MCSVRCVCVLGLVVCLMLGDLSLRSLLVVVVGILLFLTSSLSGVVSGFNTPPPLPSILPPLLCHDPSFPVQSALRQEGEVPLPRPPFNFLVSAATWGEASPGDSWRLSLGSTPRLALGSVLPRTASIATPPARGDSICATTVLRLEPGGVSMAMALSSRTPQVQLEVN